MDTEQNNLQVTFDMAVRTARDLYPEETKRATFALMMDDQRNPIILDWIKGNYPQTRTDDEELEKRYLVYVEQPASFLCRVRENNNLLLCLKSQTSFFGNNPKKEALFTFWHEMGHIVDPKTYIEGKSFFTSFEESAKKENACEITADIFACLHGLKQNFLNENDIANTLPLLRMKEAIEYAHLGHYTVDALNHFAQNPPKNITSLTPQEIKAIAIQHAEKFPLDYAGSNKKLTEIRKKIGAKGLSPD